MNKMPCRITDDPYCDYSDYFEGTGVYSHSREAPSIEESERQVRGGLRFSPAPEILKKGNLTNDEKDH